MAKDQILNKFTTIQVQDYVSFIPDLLQYFQLKVSHFRAGRLSSYIEQWKLLTSDDFILDLVKGAHIELLSASIQAICPQEKQFSCNERQIIGSEIKSLLAKGVIVPSVTEPGEFISPIFLTPKKDGSYRMILNLKHFNTHVAYYHFKMDTLASAINLMKPHCFMASLDLKDAYYSVPVSASDQKYLKFTWDGQLFHFVCFPNGLACCPRLFTKLLKPVYARLRQQGHESSGYIDDSYLQGDDFPDCVANVKATVCLFDSFGFITHPDKSVLIPTQRLTYLIRQGNRFVSYPKVANSSMVAKSDENVDTRTNPIANREAHIDSTKSTKSGLSEANPSTMPGIGGFLKDRGLSQQAAELVLQSWREGTRKQYNPYIKRWQLYCSERQVDSISAPIEVGVNFLAELYDSGVGYSAVNTARSALSSYLVLPEGCQFGTHPLVRRVMKGVFETRPSLPRYSATWDVAVVLRYLAKMHPADKLSLKDLTLKVVTLLALLSGQRRQTLHALKISCMVLTPDNCVFVLDKLLKTSKPGRRQRPMMK